jgi:hypothetical protein|tara:strand:+ start:575 stop:733 length:159 start_codon:yes stop_codon:yes gene_type:complete
VLLVRVVASAVAMAVTVCSANAAEAIVAGEVFVDRKEVDEGEHLFQKKYIIY